MFGFVVVVAAVVFSLVVIWQFLVLSLQAALHFHPLQQRLAFPLTYLVSNLSFCSLFSILIAVNPSLRSSIPTVSQKSVFFECFPVC